jgi:hypothetical protein
MVAGAVASTQVSGVAWHALPLWPVQGKPGGTHFSGRGRYVAIWWLSVNGQRRCPTSLPNAVSRVGFRLQLEDEYKSYKLDQPPVAAAKLRNV